MSTREKQAWNDGRVAFREGKQADKCPRRAGAQRRAWLNGYEHERRIALAERATPEQRQEAARVAQMLRDFAKTL